jgi:murein L,D-transpeptidase YafK
MLAHRWFFRQVATQRGWSRSFFRTTTLAVVIAAALVGTAGTIAQSVDDAIRTLPDALVVDNPKIFVIKSTRKLYLFDGDHLVRSYSVSLGSEAVGQKNRAGDGRTPEGLFRICTKNALSPNHRFLGINYPDQSAIVRGASTGLVSEGEALAIVTALRENRCPPWTTALGGGLGFHGTGSALQETAGCIGLLDRDIEELFSVLRMGDPVEILP